MKTGIVIYSQTGHTRQAAQMLLEVMRKKGLDSELLEVNVSNPKPEESVNKLQFSNKPALEPFDKVVFASPVWAFSLSGVMKAYMTGLPSLNGKKINLFVTHQLPLPWMGGNAAIRQMKRLCEEKGARVVAYSIISWNGKRRDKDISDMLNKLT